MVGNFILKRIIVASQRSPRFAARGAYSFTPAVGGKPDSQFPEADTEYADHVSFERTFAPGGFRLTDAIRGQRILDFGSGYGGRSAWYAQFAREVHGVEVFPSLVRSAADYAARVGCSNCFFHLGTEDRIDFPDGYFDVIVSSDVLEHVQRPDVVIAELHRVLRADGRAYIAFTPYWGMFAHHLNYITLAPAIHWFFTPRTIVEAVNQLLDDDPRFAGLINQQPAPRPAYNGRRLVLPTLNGLTKRAFLRQVRALGFELNFVRSTPILERFEVAGRLGALMNSMMCRVPVLDEALGFNLAAVLRKRYVGE